MAQGKASPDYGLDTPGSVRKSLLLGTAGVAFGVGFSYSKSWTGVFFGITLGILSCFPLCRAMLRMAYSAWGKQKVRDRMVGSIEWSGAEQVLDFGTGRGLLAVAAGKRLITGKAIGVDVWRPDDLSGNNRRNAQLNAELERVQDRVEIHREEPKALSFPDASFDIVLSHNYIHHLPRPVDRERACQEIGRVLRPGGVAVIADSKFTEDYLAAFSRAQCSLRGPAPERVHFYPAVRLFTVRKAGEAAS